MALALFDLDNTLADRDAAFRRWLAAFVERFGLDPGLVPWLITADGDGFVPRPVFFGQVRDRLGLEEPADALVAWYDETYPACYVEETESIAALQRLRSAGWLIAIVTNGRTVQQRAKAERTGLAAAADAICVSEELGVRKPDPRIFHEAARQCGVDLEGWMVGDSPEADVAGGAAVGLRTIWLARRRQWGPALPRPDATVATIAEAVTTMLTKAP